MNALILVDLQQDFLPGGALAVPEGDQVVPVANDVVGQFELVIATRDWHPANHASFAANHRGQQPGEVIELDGISQVLWPVHCVQDTRGASFAPGLDLSRVERVFPKGTNPRIDSYSGFFDNGHRQGTGLAEYLQSRGVHEVYLLGLATDYCVKFTALDARGLGYRTTLIEDGCRGVNLQVGDDRRAIEAMRQAGVRVVRSTDLARTIPFQEKS